MLAVVWLGGTVDQLTSGGLLNARPCGQRVDSPELRASWHLGGYVAALNLTGAGTGRLAPVWSICRLESEAVNLIWTVHVSTALCCARCDRPTAQGRWTHVHGAPTSNIECIMPLQMSCQASTRSTRGPSHQCTGCRHHHSRPLKDLQPAQVPRLDTLQCHAPVTPLLLDPHLAFVVSPRPGVCTTLP